MTSAKTAHSSAAPSSQATRPAGFWGSFAPFAADIKLAHSIFALPFAVSAFLISDISLPTWTEALLLLVCMVTARTFAMGMNRYLDRDVDLLNPRTQGRKIPNGELQPGQALGWSMVAAAIFVGSAFLLNPLAGYCSVPLLFILMAYSWQKRISWLTHWYLGACLGLAPLGVAIALTGQADPAVMLLGAAVAMWTAGFDVLYSLQDLKFDQDQGLRSVPSRFGVRSSLWLSRISFGVMIAALTAAGWLAQCGTIYFLGVALVGLILVYEHYLVRDVTDDGYSTKINVAFFTMNAWVSVVFYIFSQIDYWLR